MKTAAACALALLMFASLACDRKPNTPAAATPPATVSATQEDGAPGSESGEDDDRAQEINVNAIAHAIVEDEIDFVLVSPPGQQVDDAVGGTAENAEGGVMTHLYAYSFLSPLSMAEVRQRLNDMGQWEWIERDNDEWGEYISARVLRDPHEHGMVKLISDEGRYIINVYLRSNQPGAAAEFAKVRDIVFQQLLPALGASEIQKTDDIES